MIKKNILMNKIKKLTKFFETFIYPKSRRKFLCYEILKNKLKQNITKKNIKKEEIKKMKNLLQKINNITKKKKINFAFVILFFVLFSFTFGVGIASATTTVSSLTYSTNPVKSGTNNETVSATFAAGLSGSPTIGITASGGSTITAPGTAMTAPSMGTWANATNPEADNWTGVASNGAGTWVAVANVGTSRLAVSTNDGATWSVVSNAFAAAHSLYSVVYSSDKNIWVVVATDGATMWSTNPTVGSSWTAGTGAPAGDWYSVVYGVAGGNGVGYFVAVGDSYASLMYSTDGKAWTSVTPTAASVGWDSIAFGNGYFVATSRYDTSNTKQVLYTNNPTISTAGAGGWSASAGLGATNNSWRAVTFGNGRFVAVANAGTATNRVMYSDNNGATWTNPAPTVAANYWDAIAYGSGYFMAANRTGSTTGTMYSKDGITWTALAASNANQCYGLNYGNGVFVGVSMNSSSIMRIAVGSSYTYTFSVPSGSTYDGNANVTITDATDLAAPYTNTSLVIDTTPPTATLAYTSGNAKAGVSQTITATFNEAVADSPVPQISISGANTVAATNMTKVDTTHYTYTYTTSGGNGNAFVSISAATDSLGNVINTVPINNAFVIDNTSPTVGLSYTKDPIGLSTQMVYANYSESIASAPTISISQNGTQTVSGASIIAPGSSWTNQTPASSSVWYGVAYGNNMFVAVATGGQIMSSPDGVTWSTQTPLGTQAWDSVTFGNNLFVAVSTAGSVMYSSNGTSWFLGTSTGSYAWRSVAYGGGYFIAVASGGQVMVSTNGSSWSSQTATGAYSWYGITYGNGIFTTVSSTGNVMYSNNNGSTWLNSQTVPEANAWRSVTFGNNLFVAVSTNGTHRVMTSPDGNIWTVRNTIGANGWQSVTYGNGIFVAVANSSSANQSMTSTNGTTWVNGPAVNNYWTSVVFGNNIFVAVASGGQVMTSSAGYSYSYAVQSGKDGTATVSLSSVSDLAGNTASAPTGNTFTVDTVGATVALSYSANPAKAGSMTITATYNKSVTSAPSISIDQPGSIDISNYTMSGSGSVYTYSYLVSTATGGTYIDGTATISLSQTVDALGNISNNPTNTTFAIDTANPVITLTAPASSTRIKTPKVSYTLNETLATGSSINFVGTGGGDTNTHTCLLQGAELTTAQTLLTLDGHLVRVVLLH